MVLTMLKPCIVSSSEGLSASNCNQSEQQLISYFNVDQNAAINAVKPLDEVYHSLT
jgi:hypothetical protein